MTASGTSDIAQQLGIAGEQRITVYGAQNRPAIAGRLPDAAFLAENGARYPADTVLLFVDTAADLAHEAAAAAEAVEPGGVLWVCYPTAEMDGHVPDLNRDTVASLFESNGWEPVADAELGGDWSAVRGRLSTGG